MFAVIVIIIFVRREVNSVVSDLPRFMWLRPKVLKASAKSLGIPDLERGSAGPPPPSTSLVLSLGICCFILLCACLGDRNELKYLAFKTNEVTFPLL